jgi:hypothetical protein
MSQPTSALSYTPSGLVKTVSEVQANAGSSYAFLPELASAERALLMIGSQYCVMCTNVAAPTFEAAARRDNSGGVYAAVYLENLGDRYGFQAALRAGGAPITYVPTFVTVRHGNVIDVVLKNEDKPVLTVEDILEAMPKPLGRQNAVSTSVKHSDGVYTQYNLGNNVSVTVSHMDADDEGRPALKRSRREMEDSSMQAHGLNTNTTSLSNDITRGNGLGNTKYDQRGYMIIGKI